VLSIIGLTLDLIGAGLLAFGLFRHTEVASIMSGTSRPPEEAASDQAYGWAGFLLLGSGFVLQGLTQIGVGPSGSMCEKAIAAVCALVGGAVLAYLIYGIAFTWRLQAEVRRLRETSSLNVREVRRKRRGLRFWAFEVVDEEGSASSGSSRSGG
jgi:hypothetical protein